MPHGKQVLATAHTCNPEAHAPGHGPRRQQQHQWPGFGVILGCGGSRAPEAWKANSPPPNQPPTPPNQPQNHKGKLRNEPLHRSTRLFVGMALQFGDQVRRCVCPRLGRHPVKVVRTKYWTKQFLVSLKTTEKRYISQKMLHLPHFSALGRATKAPGERR